jgi:hypothetical protein
MSTYIRYPTGSSGGTVTSVSVASANGFAGSSSGGATPSLTLSTTVTGIVIGNGTALSAGLAGTDYSAGTSALATGILKSTTSTGALTIAVAGDFPTLNQNTSGSAASVSGTNVVTNSNLAQMSANTLKGNNTAGTANATDLTVSQVNSMLGTLTNPMTTLGDIIYENATPAATRLAGNTTSTKNFLVQTGTGTVSAAPSWGTIAAGDVPTLNQNTTGSAAKWTTARNLAGNSVDGSANVAFANKFIVQGTTDSGLSGAQFLGALGTGIVKNTTTTGALTIAVASDFPTLNQNTTGTATTATNLAGGAAGSLPYQTGSGTTSFLADTSGAILTGGTTPAYVAPPGTAGNILTDNGTAWTSSASITSGKVNPSTWTISNFGTSTFNFSYQRVKNMLVCYNFVISAGTTAAGTASINLPTGLAIDTGGTDISNITSGMSVGIAYVTTGSIGNHFTSGAAFPLFFDGSTSGSIFFANSSNSSGFVKANASSFLGANASMSGSFSIPIVAWRNT